ncbi:zf-HC2 domain-containing protein [SCandidatus Aminicenantes bacterium Aminicenantia_JdfR_composite]|jgi:hypothetical protein|nr:zf-HC2 domain-containing protein [SCandidatus Aminicenantes bacterium Aminicenantia_JdfR_composite]MCP2598633.1 zf-HC2 domain-containing protein [Candidatus Aminicenantes bacterium AC-335-L06]
MKCEEFEEILSLYIEGEISGKIKTNLEKHLQECSNCKSFLTSMLDIKKTLSNFPELEVSNNLIENILRKTKPKKGISLIIPYLEPALATLAALIIIISLLIPHSQKIYLAIEKQIYSIYGEIKELEVKGESLKGILIGYKENLLDSFKEKNFILFKIKPLKEKLKLEEKNGRKENNSTFSS